MWSNQFVRCRLAALACTPEDCSVLQTVVGDGNIDLYCIVADDSRCWRFAVIDLSHGALRNLTTPAELRSEGDILDRHFLQLKLHVINDHHRVADSSFGGCRVARGVLLRRGMGWFVGLITPKSQGREKNVYVYRVHLEADQGVRSMNLLLDAYGTENSAAVGSWVFLEPNDAGR